MQQYHVYLQIIILLENDSKNYNNSRSAKIRTPVLRSNLFSSVSGADNANGKVLATNCVTLHNYVESPTSCYSQLQHYRSTLYPSNTSQTSKSTHSSCISNQEFYDACSNGSQHAAKENVRRTISQRWVTSLYDIYLVTQKFNPTENMHQNYLGILEISKFPKLLKFKVLMFLFL